MNNSVVKPEITFYLSLKGTAILPQISVIIKLRESYFHLSVTGNLAETNLLFRRFTFK